MNAHLPRVYRVLSNRVAIAAAAVLAVLLPAPVRASEKLELDDRWVYVSTNLLVDRNLPILEEVMRRASESGYTGVLLADSKFSRLEDMEEGYFNNIKKVKALAVRFQLNIIPAIFPIGYSDAILSRDPNLAEAMPVRDALFVVKGAQARVVADPPVALKAGDFASLAKWDWKDEGVVADRGAVRITDPKGKNARIAQKVTVSPFRQYHLSVRVKARDFQGEPRVAVLGGGWTLNHANLGVRQNQDWTDHHVVFNSLTATEVTIYLGAWGGGTGNLWFDDAVLEEAGPVNIVRRDGAPLVLKTDFGRVLEEGKDFQPLADPRMGTVPYAGSYEVWHEPPVLKVPLPDGARLRVSYYHAITVHDGQVMICPSEPKTMELLRDQATRMHEAWGAKSYFMSHDEVRVLNWDESCQRRGMTSGAIMADNVRECAKILREVNPDGRIFVWSDMFDPNHNARADYYLVKGSLAGSWEGLDKDVIIACWLYEQRAASLKWFTDRGHKILIAGYYDDDPNLIREWIEAARPLKSVLGVMYTTWKASYSDLEAFGQLVEKHR